MSFLASLATPARSMGSSETGSASQSIQRFPGVGLLVGPLGRAAGNAGRRDRDRLAGQQRIDGVLGVVRLDGLDFSIVESAGVAELALGVEDEHLRRGQHAVGLGRRLRLAVVEVRVGEVVILGPDFHFLERVAEVGVAQLIEPDRGRVVG